MLAYPPKMNRASPLRLLLAAAALLGAAAGAWVVWLPDVGALKSRPPKTTAYIELRKYQAAAKKKSLDLRWTFVPYGEISENLKRAVVTAEDDEFWRHDGVDWNAIRAAYERNRKAGRFAAGGSTITMQLARNLYLSPSKNPLRKAKEILIARRLEKQLGKVRILELYLNVVEWGQGVFGCEAAANVYFQKSCAELSPDESVALAVVLPNPRRWNPAKPGQYVERNSRRIVERMLAADRARALAAGVDEDSVIADLVDEAAAISTTTVTAPDSAAFELQSGSTTVNSSTGSTPDENGRKPERLE